MEGHFLRLERIAADANIVLPPRPALSSTPLVWDRRSAKVLPFRVSETLFFQTVIWFSDVLGCSRYRDLLNLVDRCLEVVGTCAGWGWVGGIGGIWRHWAAYCIVPRRSVCGSCLIARGT